MRPLLSAHRSPPLSPSSDCPPLAAARRRPKTNAGGSTGFAIGAYQTLRHPLPSGAAGTAKLRANRLLNSAGSLGRSFGNSAGALGLFFACFESGLLAQVDGAVPDAASTVVAGFMTAAVYRAPRGPRTAAVAGAVGAVAGAGLAALRTRFPSL